MAVISHFRQNVSVPSFIESAAWYAHRYRLFSAFRSVPRPFCLRKDNGDMMRIPAPYIREVISIRAMSADKKSEKSGAHNDALQQQQKTKDEQENVELKSMVANKCPSEIACLKTSSSQANLTLKHSNQNKSNAFYIQNPQLRETKNVAISDFLQRPVKLKKSLAEYQSRTFKLHILKFLPEYDRMQVFENSMKNRNFWKKNVAFSGGKFRGLADSSKSDCDQNKSLTSGTCKKCGKPKPPTVNDVSNSELSASCGKSILTQETASVKSSSQKLEPMTVKCGFANQSGNLKSASPASCVKAEASTDIVNERPGSAKSNASVDAQCDGKKTSTTSTKSESKLPVSMKSGKPKVSGCVKTKPPTDPVCVKGSGAHIDGSKQLTSSGALSPSPASTCGGASNPPTTSTCGGASKPPATSTCGGAPKPPTTSTCGGASKPPTTSTCGAPSKPTTTSTCGGASKPPTTSTCGGASKPPTTSTCGGASKPPTTSTCGGASKPPTSSTCGAPSKPPTTSTCGGASKAPTSTCGGASKPPTTSTCGGASKPPTTSTCGGPSKPPTTSTCGDASKPPTTSTCGGPSKPSTSSSCDSASKLPSTSTCGGASKPPTTSTCGGASKPPTSTCGGASKPPTTSTCGGASKPPTTSTCGGASKPPPTSTCDGASKPPTTSTCGGASKPSTTLTCSEASKPTTTVPCSGISKPNEKSTPCTSKLVMPDSATASYDKSSSTKPKKCKKSKSLTSLNPLRSKSPSSVSSKSKPSKKIKKSKSKLNKSKSSTCSGGKKLQIPNLTKLPISLGSKPSAIPPNSKTSKPSIEDPKSTASLGPQTTPATCGSTPLESEKTSTTCSPTASTPTKSLCEKSALPASKPTDALNSAGDAMKMEKHNCPKPMESKKASCTSKPNCNTNSTENSNIKTCGGDNSNNQRSPPSGVPPPPKKMANTYRNLSAAVILLVISLCSYTFKNIEHKPRLEFVPYEYLYRRNKRFPWGDGNRSFFHNPEVNALPDGYEENHEEECDD